MRGLVAAAVVGLLAAGCWYLWMEDAESEAPRKEDKQPDAPETKKSEPAGMFAPQILAPTSTSSDSLTCVCTTPKLLFPHHILVSLVSLPQLD